MKLHSKISAWSVAIALASLAAVSTVRAVPYASGVTNDAGVVSFILNESADSVRILLNNGAITNDLGAVEKGKTNFSLGGATNYQIFVTKSNAAGFNSIIGASTNGTVGITNYVGAVSQISADTNVLLTFNSPRGVSVNRDPKSPYFGRIYVANSAAGTVTNSARACGDGLYLLNADQTDAVGQGDTALTGGLDFTTGAGASPYRITVGADNNLYVADWSDAAGNVYMVDPNASASSGKMILKQIASNVAPGNAAVPVGTSNTHGSIAAVYVDGATTTTNLRVYTIDEDLQASKTATAKTQMNSLWRYDINGGTLPATNDATRMWSPSGREGIGFASQTMDLDRSVDGKLYVTTLRFNGTESGLVVRSATGTSTAASLFVSYTASGLIAGAGSADLLYGSRAVATSPNQRFVAVHRHDGRTWIVPLIAGIPDLSRRVLVDTFTNLNGNSGRSARFDAAGNLYILADQPQMLRVFSPGGITTAVTGNNSSGTAGSFNLYEQPVIYNQPETVTDIAGTNATFSVVAGGPSSTLTYQWYFNDAPIAGQTTNTLVRTNIQVNTLAGYYKVVVSNAFYPAVTSAVASLIVTDSPPIITIQPTAAVTIGAGSNATAFAVTTIGSDTRSYQWQLNGTNIMGATTSSLARNNCQQPMAGTYFVTISNAFGSVTSAGTTLTVNDMAPVLSTQPVSRTVASGSNVTFTVVSPGGTDPRSYFWMVNGNVIDGATNTSYVVTNAQPAMSGNAYSVMVSNLLGTVTSTNGVLTVTNTPNIIFITQPASVTVGAGSNVTFSTTAFGDGPLSYQWNMNGSPITGATSNTFVWIDAQTNHTSTNFSVTISNAGTPVTSSNAVLTVTNRIPLIVGQPVSTTTTVGGGASFSVTVQGQGPFTYQWKLGTNNLVGKTSSTLSLSNVQLADAATNYNVAVSNAVGGVTSTNVQLAVLVSSSTGSGTGLTGEYYASHYLAEIPATNGYISFTGTPTVSRIDPTVDFLWTGSPDSTVPPDYFFVRWTGQVQPLYSQDYTFSTLSDDGIRLWIDGKLLIDQWKSGGNQNYSVVVSNMVAGQKYDVRIEYVEITGNGEAHLFWSSASQTRAIIPTSQLYPDSGPYVIAISPTNRVMAAGESVGAAFTVTAGPQTESLSYQWQKNGQNIPLANNSSLDLNSVTTADIGNYSVVVTGSLGVRTSTVPVTLTVTGTTTPGTGTGILGEYFTKSLNTTPWYTNAPVLSRVDPTVDFIWGTSSADISVSGDTNVVRWTGQLEPLYSQVYTFQSISDDGIRVWVDGLLIIDKWVTGTIAVNNYTATMPYAFVAGQKYDIRVEYFDRTTTSEAHVYWYSGSQPREVIPTTQLYPTTGAYLITEPANVNAVLNSNLTLTVYAGGSDTVSYQWKKNGNNIPGATTSTLTFAPVQLADAANYSIVVSNSISARTSTNGTLSIAPYITQQPTSATVNVGSPATFSVTAGGSGTLAYQWKFNNVNILDATNSSYTVSSPTLADAGSYNVVITGFGSITSSNAVLTVSSGTATSPTIGSITTGGGNVGFSFNTEAGHNYHIQFTTSLSIPFADVEVIAGTGSSVSRNYAVGATNGFYRLVVD